MHLQLKGSTAALLLMGSSAVFAAQTGGFATTDGGNISGAKSFTAQSYNEINTILANARIDPSTGKKVAGGAYPLIITYTGNEDALIDQVIKDHTPRADGTCPNPRWNDTYREVQIKEFTKGVTIQGADGSSANFGITMIKSANVVVKNMKLGALGGANSDADLLRIDNSSNIWIDHNELFALNVECKGSPDSDLTFESALDIKKDSQNITVSYNVIRDSKKVGLMGHTVSSGQADFQRTVTYHHNIYRNVNGRLPLQRGGWTHMYNNIYEQITGSGINVRSGGYALIENNWFQNSKNPVTCRFDTVNCGKWDLRNNNTSSAASNAIYGIVWDSAGSGGANAENWSTTGAFPITLPYSYQPVSAQCVKDKLANYAGVGKNGVQLTAAICGGSTGEVGDPTGDAPDDSSSGSAPVLSGTGDYPTGFRKCADLNKSCAVSSGTGWVAFGRKGNWVSKYVGVGSSIACTVAAFGSDPGGNPNKCSIQS